MRVASLIFVLSTAVAFTTQRCQLSPRILSRNRATSNRVVRMEVKDILDDSEERMKKSIESVNQNLNTLRTGRATPSLLDRINVDYYGCETPLNQLAGVSVSSGTSLVVDPYDKSALAEIEKALMESDIGIMPQNNGDVIRLSIPAVTEDRRKELLKTAKSLSEDGKVAIRNIRRDALDQVKKLQKSDDISEDNAKDAQESIQSLTDKYVKQVESTMKDKETEIMTV